jgi:murein DD-endopeptidase MepM/ murein hydrolase activator NlpD
MLRSLTILSATSVATLLIACAHGPQLGLGYMQQRTGQLHNSLHTGLDLHAAIGTPVRAPQAARVTGAGPEYLELTHSSGWRTQYQHIDSVQVQLGQSVAAGQILARVAMTGQRGVYDGRPPAYPHLHMELKDDNGRGHDPETLKMTCDGRWGWWWPVGCRW